MSTIHAAACACGAVQRHFDHAPRSMVHCHCGLCRRLSGSAFTTWVTFKRSGMTAGSEGEMRSYSASSHTVRNFCPVCGTHVFTADARDVSIVGVPAGVLGANFSCAATAHYFVDDGASWHAIDDALPRFGGASGFEPAGASNHGACAIAGPPRLAPDGAQG
jgi:hypothetical protein